MGEYTKITRKQYVDGLTSRIENLKKEELKNSPDSRIKLQKLITSVGLETAYVLESMEEPELKPVYLKLNGVDALFGSNSFEVMPQIRYDQITAGNGLYQSVSKPKIA